MIKINENNARKFTIMYYNRYVETDTSMPSLLHELKK